MVQRGQGQSAGKSQVFEDSMARSPDPGFGVNQSQNSSFEGSMARSPAPGFGWHPSHNSSFEGSMARSPAPGFGWNSHQNSGYWRVSFKARSQVRSWVLSLPADFNTLRRFFSCCRTEMKWKGWRGKWCDAGSKQLQPDKCWYVQNEGANLVRCSLDTQHKYGTRMKLYPARPVPWLRDWLAAAGVSRPAFQLSKQLGGHPSQAHEQRLLQRHRPQHPPQQRQLTTTCSTASALCFLRALGPVLSAATQWPSGKSHAFWRTSKCDHFLKMQN